MFISRKHWKLFISLLSILSIGTLIACSGGNTKEDVRSKVQQGSNSPAKITLMAPYTQAEPIKQDNRGLAKIEELTNTKLDVTWIPLPAYNDKVNVVLASNSLPDATAIIQNKAPGIVNAARSGMFWELGPYLKDYKNLSNISPLILNNISIDGKIFGLPRERPLARDGMIFRKDWLDQLGLQEPKTIDDIYKIIKAFTSQDPDKNGKNDTYGLTEGQDFRGFNVILAYFGAPNGWEIKDGKFIPDFMTKEYMDTMKFFKRLYDEKLMNQDFLVTNRLIKSDNINNGKAGLYMDNVSHVSDKFDSLYKTNPKAELDVVSRINGPKGERVFSTSGHNGMYVIPKTSVKTEAQLKQILAYFDKLYEANLLDIRGFGIEGIHYTLENGKKVSSTEQKQLFNKEIFDLQALYTGRSEYELPAGTRPAVLKAMKMEGKENLDIIINNPVEPLISNTYVEKGTVLDNIILDARVKFIVGKIDETGWNSSVEQWSNSGGNKVIEEYRIEYEKTKKK